MRSQRGKRAGGRGENEEIRRLEGGGGSGNVKVQMSNDKGGRLRLRGCEW
jgi:hypothetical protein